MSTFETAHPTYGMAARAAALLSAVRGAWLAGMASLTERRRARRNVRILGHMSDRDLKDIGLTRSDLPRLVHGQRPMRLGERPPAL